MSSEEQYYDSMNMLLAPVNFLFNAIKYVLVLLGFILFIVPCVIYMHIGWIVGMTDHGYFYRMDEVRRTNSILAEPEGRDTHITYTVDFRQNSPDPEYNPVRIPDNFPSWQKARQYLDFQPNEVIHTSSVFPDDFNPDPCNWPGLANQEKDWDERPKSLMDYKSDVLSSGLRGAAASISILRYAMVKILMRTPTPAMQAALQGRKGKYICMANAGDPSQMSLLEWREWEVLEDSIRLPDAPVIRIEEAKSKILGMCWVNEKRPNCPGDLQVKTTFYGDIFIGPPVLPKDTVDLIKDFKEMRSLKFWLIEAHANGIVDHDEELRQIHSQVETSSDENTDYASL
jgi:hypothetical protein